jgi:hypothetical protein
MATNRSSRDTRPAPGTSLLPEILELTIAQRRFDPPRIFFVGPERRQIHEAVTIDVRTSHPIPAVAVPPVLFVADVPLLDFEPLDPERYRFFALEPLRLQQGAPISFGYPDMAPAQRVRTRFGFRLDSPPVS